VGTRAWKEFDVDGTRVETRLLAKVGPDDATDWIDLAYVWLPDGSDAVATPDGAVDALGTAHDVPSAAQCAACHGGRASHLLGVSAIQLEDHPIEPAVGYLYANCSHCHNQRRPARRGARCYDPENDVNFDLTLNTLDAPPARHTADEHGDEMLSRMGQRGDDQMPPLATEQVDDEGLALVRAYVQ
jgi:mono/diheme cytochrome c family protein